MSEREWPEILVMGYSEAGMFLRGGGAGRAGAVLSIQGGREFGVEWERGPRLDLVFDDVEVPAEGDWVAVQQARVRRRWEEEHGLVQRGPTVEDARAIVEFARGIRGMGGVLLCHCGGGVSRGPAAAILCLATWRREGFEGACVEEVLRGRRGACPHADLVRMGDEVLGRGGRLSGGAAGMKWAKEHRGVMRGWVLGENRLVFEIARANHPITMGCSFFFDGAV